MYGQEDRKTCASCEAGYYCVEGTEDAAQRIPCPRGKYNDETEGQNEGACKNCLEGSYVAPGSTECRICDLGNYCPDPASETTTQFAATLCPEATYNNEVGQSLLAACVACDATGTYAYNPNTRTGCKNCEEGYYCPDRELPDATECPLGTFNDETNAVSDAACRNCPAGFSTTPKAPRGECIACAVGSYCPGADEEAGAPVTDCPTGRYNSETQRSSLGDCLACAAGFYADEEGLMNCKTCGSGSYVPVTRLECLICPVGAFCVSPAVEAPVDCANGTTNRLPGQTDPFVCKPCAREERCFAGKCVLLDGQDVYDGFGCSKCKPVNALHVDCTAM